MAHTTLLFCTFLAIVVGIVGTLVPVLPGLFFAWAATLVFGLIDGFGPVGWVAFAASTGLLIMGTYLGLRIPQRDAADQGLSLWDQLFAALLAIIGAFVVPVVGLPLGFALGVFLAQLRRTPELRSAWAATVRTLKSLGKATLVQAACGMGILMLWIAWVIID